MKKIRYLFRSEPVKVILRILTAAGGGFVLSIGTISGVASPLAAALAGVCPPLYAFAVLFGSLAAYMLTDTPESMQFLLCCLVAIVCCRILFREVNQPHTLSIMTAFCCIAAGVVEDLMLTQEKRLPLYILESLLTGIAAYFLSDAAKCLRERRRIPVKAGRSFTFAICYLLCITALCGVNTEVGNLGRAVGTAFTLLCSKQLRQHGGTLCGALTSCGVALCSVKLGMPVLFLPVTAMLMGYLSGLPNALFIPAFFLMEGLSSAVLDSSMELARVAVELIVACTLYGLCSHVELFRFISPEEPPVLSRGTLHDSFLGGMLHELEAETETVMQRLALPEPESIAEQLRQRMCAGCGKYAECWRQRHLETERAFLQLGHSPYRRPLPQGLGSCIRHDELAGAAAECARNTALFEIQRVHRLQDRRMTIEYLQLLQSVVTDRMQQSGRVYCTAESRLLQHLLKRLSCKAESSGIYRLEGGRYVAEVYTSQQPFPLAAVRELLQERLGVTLLSMEIQSKEDGQRICLYEKPVYQMSFEIYSVNSPGCSHCGDQADGFTDGAGNSYLVLSDGMGSGNAASLAARIAVRTLRRMICSGMAPETAIRLVNALLLTETNTENFATLDICALHADTGVITLYKAGAAATLLCRRTKVHRIASRSFPVGIVPDAKASVKQIYGLSGDYLVMLSDGISEGEYPYIRQLLQQGVPLQKITRMICEKAAVFQGGEVRDDMTVIAARVWTGNSSESTKTDREPAYHHGQIAVSVS